MWRTVVASACAIAVSVASILAQHGYSTLAVTIGACYPVDARPSHYRAGPDTLKIIAMVATHLLSKRLHLRGLWRSLQREPETVLPPRGSALDSHR